LEETALATGHVQIYVPLLNEGTDVLRPTAGHFVRSDTVRVEALDDYDPIAEEWESPPGSDVHCVVEFRSGQQILVARSRAFVHP